MKKLTTLFAIVLTATTMTFAMPGCGAPGGSEGDENDPAATGGDDEQMQDETGEMDGDTDGGGDDSGAAGGV
jgi:hypothetical protein